jgi:PilZ domain
MQTERRRALRFPFDASAEVSREKTDARLPARVTEIGPNGCYLQMGAPFETGTSLFVRILVEGSFFETHATVMYSQPNAGMGVAFRDLKPYFVEVLKKWLLETMHAKQKPRD